MALSDLKCIEISWVIKLIARRATGSRGTSRAGFGGGTPPRRRAGFGSERRAGDRRATVTNLRLRNAWAVGRQREVGWADAGLS
jgi:hypothetical protein